MDHRQERIIEPLPRDVKGLKQGLTNGDVHHHPTFDSCGTERIKQ
jgi:hypothetical protein